MERGNLMCKGLPYRRGTLIWAPLRKKTRLYERGTLDEGGTITRKGPPCEGDPYRKGHPCAWAPSYERGAFYERGTIIFKGHPCARGPVTERAHLFKGTLI